MYVFRVLETLCHCVGTLLNIELRTSSAQSYVFDSSMEAQVNMRFCSLDGLDRDIVATVQRMLSQVNLFVEICDLENTVEYSRTKVTSSRSSFVIAPVRSSIH